MLGDIVFLAGPVAAVLVVPATAVVVVVWSQARWALWALVAVAPIASLSWVAFWVSWELAFPYADRGQRVPGRIEMMGDVAMALCAAASVVLIAVAVVSLTGTRSMAAPSTRSAA